MSAGRPAAAGAAATLLAASLAAAWLFGVVELLAASAAPHWLGGAPAAWGVWALGLAAYAGGIAGAGLVVHATLGRLGATGGIARPAASVLLVAVAAAGALAAGSARLGAGGAAAVAAAATAVTAAAVVLGARGPAVARAVYGLAVVSLAAGAATLALGAALVFVVHDAAMVARVLAVADAAAVFALGLAVLARRREAPWRALVPAVALAAAVPVALAVLPRLTAAAAGPHRPSVLLVTADALRADLTSAYGGPVPTPHLEAMAARGVRLAVHHALAPWTIPSLDALFASKYPPGLSPGASEEQRRTEEMSYHNLASYWAGPDGLVLPDHLGLRGYDTAVVCANPAMAFQQWLLGRFAHRILVDPLAAPAGGAFAGVPLLRDGLARWVPALGAPRVVDSTAQVLRYAKAYLRQRRGETFFAWFHFMDPHSPYDPPARLRPAASGPWRAFPPDETRAWDVGLDDAEQAYVRGLYEGEVRYVDEALGAILAELAALGLDRTTYVVFTSDHGEELWDHGRWGHGYALWDEQVRVPLVLVGPGVEPGIVEAPTSALDLLPTLFDYLGQPPLPDWVGTSLRPAIEGRDPAALERPVFAQATDAFRYAPEPQQMVRRGRWKLVRGLDSGRRTLFDLEADPAERDDRAPAEPAAVRRLDAALDAWQATFPADFRAFPGRATVRRPLLEIQKTLEALGYVAPR